MDLNLLGLFLLGIGSFCSLFMGNKGNEQLFGLISGIGFGLIIYPFL
jgi:hypothetical protein